MSSIEQQKRFSDRNYWNKRYINLIAQQQGNPTPLADDEEDEDYEWFRTFSNLKSFFVEHLPPASTKCKILHLGCGTSVSGIYSSNPSLRLHVCTDQILLRLSRGVETRQLLNHVTKSIGSQTVTADLYAIGYLEQVSVDFSPVAIEEMRRKYATLEGLEWIVMDVRHMNTIQDMSFDIAIDKVNMVLLTAIHLSLQATVSQLTNEFKGTLDAMLYGSLWDPEDEVKNSVGAYVDEIVRVLKPGGSWLYITFRQPHFLKPLLSRERSWSLEVHSLTGHSDSFEYFCYKMIKFEVLTDESIE